MREFKVKLAFTHQIFSMQAYGGISRYYTLLAQELLRLEQEIGVFAGVYRNNYLADLPHDVVYGVKYSKYPTRAGVGRMVQVINHYLTNHQMKNWKPDLIHETYYSFLPLSKSSIPRLTTVYDMIHELYPAMFKQSNLMEQMKRKTFNRSDHIISISHSTKRDLVELLGIDENKITVVHLGVDIGSFSDYKPVTTDTLSRPFLLFVGSRGGYKNFNAVLNAMAASDKLKKDFDLVAFGGGEFNENEKSLISSLGFAEKQIRQVGGSDDWLVELYHQATAFVYPSLYEGFGLPPLEAMASLCPVISSSTSSMPEVIGDAAEYFIPSSVDDIQRAIENVVYSSSRIEQLKKQGLERVQLFGWDKCARETLDVYEKIVGCSK